MQTLGLPPKSSLASSQSCRGSNRVVTAEFEFGVYSSIIVTCVRHRGPDEALEIAELAATAQCRHLRGFGLTGNERAFDAEDFKGAFLIAENSGLCLTAHTGEWLPAKTVLRTVNVLNLSRVGHGISVAEEPDIMSELADRGVGFEICLSSNVALGASQSYEAHPARKLMNAGCRVAFSTDDPAYFSTSPKREIQLAQKHLCLTESEQRRIIEDSINMSFCDELTKSKLRHSANRMCR